MWDPALTRDRTQAPCIGSLESQLLVHQGSAWDPFLKMPKSTSGQFLRSFFQGNPTGGKAEKREQLISVSPAPGPGRYVQLESTGA